MTDKRKDEMIAELELKIRNEAYNAGLERGKELARKDQSPPVPDDVAEALERYGQGFKHGSDFADWWDDGDGKIIIQAAREYQKVQRDYAGLVKQTIEQQLEITALRATSTPSAEVAEKDERIKCLEILVASQDRIISNLASSPEVKPVTEVTVDEFERQVFGYLTENCLLDRCEIHGAILNAADKFPHGIKIKAGDE